ncbi:MAG: hypothetical protein ACE5JM_15380, partial [Armatimonadota bacterium]
IVSMVSPETVTVPMPGGSIVTDGRAAVVLTSGEAPTAACLVGGTTLKANGVELSSPAAAYSGDITGVHSADGESYFEITGDLPAAASPGAVLLVTGDDNIQRAYPIRRTEQHDTLTRIYTKTDHTGFEARPGNTWQLLPTVAREL